LIKKLAFTIANRYVTGFCYFFHQIFFVYLHIVLKKIRNLATTEHNRSKNSDQVGKDLWNRRYPNAPESSELTIEVCPDNYSAERIARAVEDCNAHVINLNVTGGRTESGNLIIDLRVSCRNGNAVARSLSRYGYDVTGIISPDSKDDEAARLRAMELLHILEI